LLLPFFASDTIDADAEVDAEVDVDATVVAATDDDGAVDTVAGVEDVGPRPVTLNCATRYGHL
jgi:hypothetical protein